MLLCFLLFHVSFPFSIFVFASRLFLSLCSVDMIWICAQVTRRWCILVSFCISFLSLCQTRSVERLPMGFAWLPYLYSSYVPVASCDSASYILSITTTTTWLIWSSNFPKGHRVMRFSTILALVMLHLMLETTSSQDVPLALSFFFPFLQPISFPRQNLSFSHLRDSWFHLRPSYLYLLPLLLYITYFLCWSLYRVVAL